MTHGLVCCSAFLCCDMLYYNNLTVANLFDPFHSNCYILWMHSSLVMTFLTENSIGKKNHAWILKKRLRKVAVIKHQIDLPICGRFSLPCYCCNGVNVATTERANYEEFAPTPVGSQVHLFTSPTGPAGDKVSAKRVSLMASSFHRQIPQRLLEGWDGHQKAAMKNLLLPMEGDMDMLPMSWGKEDFATTSR